MRNLSRVLNSFSRKQIYAYAVDADRRPNKIVEIITAPFSSSHMTIYSEVFRRLKLSFTE